MVPTLIKADWKNMVVLDLDENSIGFDGISELTKGNWKKLTNLHLSNHFLNPGQSNINFGGVCRLAKTNWDSLKTLSISII